MEPYLGLTVHFIDNDSELKIRCLFTTVFAPGPHGTTHRIGPKEGYRSLGPSNAIMAVQLNNFFLQHQNQWLHFKWAIICSPLQLSLKIQDGLTQKQYKCNHYIFFFKL